MYGLLIDVSEQADEMHAMTCWQKCIPYVYLSIISVKVSRLCWYDSTVKSKRPHIKAFKCVCVCINDVRTEFECPLFINSSTVSYKMNYTRIWFYEVVKVYFTHIPYVSRLKLWSTLQLIPAKKHPLRQQVFVCKTVRFHLYSASQ